MKIKKGFTVRTIGGESVVIGDGIEQVNFNKMVVLNPTAKFLWDNIADKEFTEDSAAALLVDEYGIEVERALEDVRKLFAQFVSAGLTEE